MIDRGRYKNSAGSDGAVLILRSNVRLLKNVGHAIFAIKSKEIRRWTVRRCSMYVT